MVSGYSRGDKGLCLQPAEKVMFLGTFLLSFLIHHYKDSYSEVTEDIFDATVTHLVHKDVKWYIHIHTKLGSISNTTVNIWQTGSQSEAKVSRRTVLKHWDLWLKPRKQNALEIY